MSIFLTGGGDQEHFHRLDKLFIQSIPSEARIGLFAQACETREEEMDALDRIIDHFSYKKIKSIELVSDPKKDLSQFDAIMIEGGNTFKLIRSIRDTHFYTSIKNFSKTGKCIYADSAGAIILGSDVHTAFLGDDGDEDKMSLQDYRGLDLLDSWCVHAHATSDDLEQLQDLLYQVGSPIFALAEETGIHLKNNEVEVFGEEPLWIVDFEGHRSINPNYKISLSL